MSEKKNGTTTRQDDPEAPAPHVRDEDVLVPQFGGALGDAVETQVLGVSSTADAAGAQAAIQSQCVLARRFPRNEDEALRRLARACKRFAFAERARYSYPRGSKKNDKGEWVKNIVEGPSVYLAREIARLFGNIRYGFSIVADSDDFRVIRGEAWDLETNAYSYQDASFKKLVQRKVGKGEERHTEWVRPDERDLRELTNKHGAIAVRNAIYAIIPEDVKDFALGVARKTVEEEVKQDPDAARRAIILGFDQLNVPVADLERVVGCKLAQASPAQIADLRGLYAAIREGQTTMADVLAEGDAGDAGGVSPGKPHRVDLSRFRLTKDADAQPPAAEAAAPDPQAAAAAPEREGIARDIEEAMPDEKKPGGEPPFTPLSEAAIARVVAACKSARVNPDDLDHFAAEKWGVPWRKAPESNETALLARVREMGKR